MNLKHIALAALLVCAVALPSSAADELNQLTSKEKKNGWKLLFDGKSLTGWHSYAKTDGPKQGWVVEDGILKCVAKGHGGDIVTVDKFKDFDLQWDWMLPAKANNGVKYLVSETRISAPGHEYQMVDDTIDAAMPAKRSTASFYEVLPPDAKKPLKTPGEWNHSRILVQGNHVEHWLNGKKVLAYELGSLEVKAAIAESKFKDKPGFGDKITGPIMLTEHQDEASYRNIKIRELTAK
ncbi:MAG: Hydroxypyruvate isomerase [Pedosphaera sp.]|nr:Hydroxypyruvate isomerase [Pedosphaera sp.]